MFRVFRETWGGSAYPGKPMPGMLAGQRENCEIQNRKTQRPPGLRIRIGPDAQTRRPLLWKADPSQNLTNGRC